MYTMHVAGNGCTAAFKNEPGGHRWQRIPPTERNGRVHTSTVTVAIMQDTQAKREILSAADVEESFTRGSGKGGQHRNKTSTACRLKHIPTGIQIKAEGERSQAQNRIAAWDELRRRLEVLQNDSSAAAASIERRSQAGSGMRGDKRRTYRQRDSIVTDHITGKKANYERVCAGELELLW